MILRTENDGDHGVLPYRVYDGEAYGPLVVATFDSREAAEKALEEGQKAYWWIISMYRAELTVLADRRSVAEAGMKAALVKCERMMRGEG